VRITKDAIERRNEILDTAEKLFSTIGYEETTVNDILDTIHIAKGTFYYHFKSKAEVLDGIIKRRGDQNMEAAKAIAGSDLPAPQKLLAIMFSQKPKDAAQQELIVAIEAAENSRLFVKSLTDILTRLAPLVGDVISQGVKEGVFDTPYPYESAELLLAAVHALFDNPDFHLSEAQTRQKAIAFLYAAEKICGGQPGIFQALASLF